MAEMESKQEGESAWGRGAVELPESHWRALASSSDGSLGDYMATSPCIAEERADMNAWADMVSVALYARSSSAYS